MCNDKQKTEEGKLRSLVGSEMCMRGRVVAVTVVAVAVAVVAVAAAQ